MAIEEGSRRIEDLGTPVSFLRRQDDDPDLSTIYHDLRHANASPPAAAIPPTPVNLIKNPGEHPRPNSPGVLNTPASQPETKPNHTNGNGTGPDNGKARGSGKGYRIPRSLVEVMPKPVTQEYGIRVSFLRPSKKPNEPNEPNLSSIWKDIGPNHASPTPTAPPKRQAEPVKHSEKRVPPDGTRAVYIQLDSKAEENNKPPTEKKGKPLPLEITISREDVTGRRQPHTGHLAIRNEDLDELRKCKLIIPGIGQTYHIEIQAETGSLNNANGSDITARLHIVNSLSEDLRLKKEKTNRLNRPPTTKRLRLELRPETPNAPTGTRFITVELV